MNVSSNDQVFDAAFPGDPGAFSQLAAWIMLSKTASLLPCREIEDVLEAVTRDNAMYGIIPVENTLAGTLSLHIKSLCQYQLPIVQETACRVEHAVIAAKGAKLEDITTILSHPVALQQCRRWFRKHPRIQQIPAYDTAGAVKDLVSQNLRDTAAIAGARNGDIYGGDVLAENIQDCPHNYTRFLLISREGVVPSETEKIKVTFLTTLENKPAALYNALAPFALRGINLTNIANLSQENSPEGPRFEYTFYMEIVSWPRTDRAELIEAAFKDLQKQDPSLRILGRYICMV